ncbi:MAG: sulfotransferase [Thermoplasmatales archaeon]|nr:sulfotransferase [Thermoplasmatales archaeon]
MSIEEINVDLDSPYLEKLENISFKPVFILGLHRSGTSILYKMLIETGCFNYVTVYHLVKYNQLIHNHINKLEEFSKKDVTAFIKNSGLADRYIDRIKVTPDTPEEYGFLLRQGNLQNMITPKNLSTFVEMAKKIQFISDKEKPLLLKNPLDFKNFIYIKKVFPEAKFIFIHRNPLKSLSSLIKALRLIFKNKIFLPNQIFKLYNKTFDNPLLLKTIKLCLSKRFPLGLILITMYASKFTKYYMKNIEQLPKEDYICITYENLCTEPQKNLEEIIRFLNIKMDYKIDFKSFIKPRKTDLDYSVLRMRWFIFRNMKNYFKKFGYELEK